MTRMWIDHVVFGVRDLDAAAARLENDHGLVSVVGGRHPGWGTGNRIVPLGSSYLELIAILDEEEAMANPIGRGLAASIAGGDRWQCWCVATDDLVGVAERLSLPVDAGSRVRPDGTTLRWRSAGFPFVLENPSLPFFISWDVPANLHPGAAAAEHRVEPRGISWIEIGEDERLDRWLAGAALPVRPVRGPAGPVAVGVATASGEIVVS
jgi:Glyoxalase-like domain